MALDTSVPWLNVQPKDFVAAASAGAEAGLGAARTMITARQVQQQASQEAARLSQQERIAQMEMQTRQEIANQNHLVQQQQLAVQNAYHQAQIGVAKDRLAEVSAVAEQKARDAAMQFADEQGFYKAVSGGAPIPQALGQFPRTPPSNVNAIRVASATKGTATPKFFPEFPGVGFIEQPSGTVLLVQRPEKTGTLGNAISLENALGKFEEQQMLLGNAKTPEDKAYLASIKERISRLKSIGGKMSGKTEAAPVGKRFAYDPASGELKPVDISNEPSHDEEP